MSSSYTKTSGGSFANVVDIFLTNSFPMGRHFLAAKANWDFLPNLPFLPILLDVLINALSLVVLTVGAVCRIRDAAASRRARRTRGSCDEEIQRCAVVCEWATGGIRYLGDRWYPVSQNLAVTRSEEPLRGGVPDKPSGWRESGRQLSLKVYCCRGRWRDSHTILP
jgi:hypothetical protein